MFKKYQLIPINNRHTNTNPLSYVHQNNTQSNCTSHNDGKIENGVQPSHPIKSCTIRNHQRLSPQTDVDSTEESTSGSVPCSDLKSNFMLQQPPRLQPPMEILEDRVAASSTTPDVKTHGDANGSSSAEQSTTKDAPPFTAFVIMNGSSKTIAVKQKSGHINSGEHDASGNVIVVAECTNKLIANDNDRGTNVGHSSEQEKEDDILENTAQTTSPSRNETETCVESGSASHHHSNCNHNHDSENQESKMNGHHGDTVAVDDPQKPFDDDVDSENDNKNDKNNGDDTHATTTATQDGVRVIGNNVIRSHQIERLIEKMATFSSTNTDTNSNTDSTNTHSTAVHASTALKSEKRVMNSRNPVTNKFSTYYNRTQAIGGTLVQTRQVGEADANQKTNQSECTATTTHNAADVVMQTTQAIDTDDTVNNEDDDDDIDVDDDEDDADEEEEDVYNSVNVGVRRRATTRLEQQNFKKAKNYCAPPEELTRLQIRHDIRKMRNPQMNDIASVLKLVGFEKYIGHKSYVSYMQPPRNISKSAYSYADNNGGHTSHSHGDDDDDDDEVQFIGTSAKRAAVLDTSHNNNNKQHRRDTTTHSYEAPPPKKAKLQSTNKESGTAAVESFTCNKCEKAFAMEVDLILHKNHDQC